MDREDVNEAKGSRRCGGRIVVRLGTPSRENFIIRRFASIAALAGERESEISSSISRSRLGCASSGSIRQRMRKPQGVENIHDSLG